MGLISGIAVFFMIWWLVIFAVLPWGVSRDTTAPIGHDAGAPKFHNMKKKVLYTTLISIVLWLAIDFVVRSDFISFYDKAALISIEGEVR